MSDKQPSSANHSPNPSSTPSPEPKPMSQGQILLEITAISGEYPASNIHRLIPAPNYSKKLVASLVKDRMLKLVNVGGLKGYRLDFKGKRKLLAENPSRFGSFLEGDTETNRSRADRTRRLRLHSMSEVSVMMHNAGVDFFQDTKPKIFPLNDSASPSQTVNEDSENRSSTHRNNPQITISTPYFYTSREQKNQDNNKIRGSRAAGILLTPYRAYAIYNTGSAETMWSLSSEKVYNEVMVDELSRKLLLHQYKGDSVHGVMMGKDMEILEKYLNPTEKKVQNLNFLDLTYESFYYITNDNHGEFQLRVLCNKAKMNELKYQFVTSQFAPVDTKFPVVHDAINKDGNPVLFCFLLDIPRLIRFKGGLGFQNKTGVVLCLTHQRDMLMRYLGNDAEVKSYNFDKTKEWLFPS